MKNILILLLLCASPILAQVQQPETFVSQAQLQSATYSGGVITIKIALPLSEAGTIQKSLGKADAQAAISQVGDETTQGIRRLSEQAFHDVRNKSLPFLSTTTINNAWDKYLLYQAELKRIADSVATAQANP